MSVCLSVCSACFHVCTYTSLLPLPQCRVTVLHAAAATVGDQTLAREKALARQVSLCIYQVIHVVCAVVLYRPVLVWQCGCVYQEHCWASVVDTGLVTSVAEIPQCMQCLLSFPKLVMCSSCHALPTVSSLCNSNHFLVITLWFNLVTTFKLCTPRQNMTRCCSL